MPLAICPDCSRAVSPIAPACPGCGRPMRATTVEQTGKPVKAVQLAFGVVVLGGVGLLASGRTHAALWALSVGAVGLAVASVVAWWRHG